MRAIILISILLLGIVKTKAADAVEMDEARVLVVDDDAMNRKLLTRLLMKIKVQGTTVSSGQECLDLVQKEHFDIIFMDHLMPEMDGVETLKRLKTLEGNLCKDTPVIALTANTSERAREEYISFGFNDFLSKPIVADKLQEMIQQTLQADVRDTPDSNSDASEEEIMLPELEGVDWNYASQNIKDKSLLLHLLQNYYQNLPDEYENISNFAAMIGKTDEAIQNYRIRVHSMKSASAQLGIMSVARLAELLEFAARDGEIEKIRVHNPLLLDELMKMKERLAPAIKSELNEKSKELVGFSKISDSIDTLRFYISQKDLDNAFQVMNQIKSYAYSPELQECITRLGKKISALEMDEALTEIANLIEKFGETDAKESLFF